MVSASGRSRRAPRASVPGSSALLMLGSAHDRVTSELLQESRCNKWLGSSRDRRKAPGWASGGSSSRRPLLQVLAPCPKGLPTASMHQLCTLQSEMQVGGTLPGRRREGDPQTRNQQAPRTPGSGHGSNTGRGLHRRRCSCQMLWAEA